MTSYRLFTNSSGTTSGPSTADSFSGNFIAGVTFGVASISWFEGYWWWVCPDGGQSTTPQKFALWQVYSSDVDNNVEHGAVIPGSVITSGTLTSGWNYVPLETPIPLSVSNNPAYEMGDGAAVYIATTGFTGPFPITGGQFTPGGAYPGGIVNGPLIAYSDGAGTAPAPAIGGGLAQGVFNYDTASDNPSLHMVLNNSSGSSNFWVDVQVSDTAPANYTGSYRLWPSLIGLFHNDTADSDVQQQTMGTQFELSEACTLNNVWFFSPSWATDMPASTQIWDLSDYSTPTLVDGTNLTADWSGAAGSGWVSNSYAGQDITLPMGQYVVTIYYPGSGNGTANGAGFYAENKGYFGTGYGNTVGPAPNGLVNGPLSSPSMVNAFNWPTYGNSCYVVTNATGYTATGVPTFPNDWDSKADYDASSGLGDDGESRWVDVEVTPVGLTITSPPAVKYPNIPLVFFP